MTDFIGDIHGHADKLEELLLKMGYTHRNGSYSHPERKVLFVGDYIDRGPKIRETLRIVKDMVDSGNATALMGNHEFNAITFHYELEGGGHLRKHLIKNMIQHYETIRQFHNRQKEYDDYIEWFKTLALFQETESFRAVHAGWDNQSIAFLSKTLPNGKLTDDLIYKSEKKETELTTALEITLRGKQITLPAGHYYEDEDGTKRNEIRVKWWKNPMQLSYSEISVDPIATLPETPVDLSLLPNADYYNHESKPVFFGHYWLRGTPVLIQQNLCCLDFSIAKNGHLAAYRFDGEKELSDSKLVYV
ncbi:Bis(5'-nucleosyl)-tetraphosphatase, symmetrical [Dyadobacter sp. CECT 9275]|uniref:Bis(5'-nucleosyl)-tetraphosphatase, symmetrical n=1 Tax=Dyadobacter helix TaxID=2822344 RepID=A0A916JBH9_9BACT|nr:metallophosphoesterase [Dyadobacter sp. CECT 9275]CAG5002089.1 Bis(5'-nucleosyl)-tetraphosphatase, symmetrical [Dyadobacter sp. CECT 9275]